MATTKINPAKDILPGTLPPTVLANTAAPGTNNTTIATTAFVNAYRPPFSSLSSATTSNNIDNLGNNQFWNWSGITNGVGLNIYSSNTGSTTSSQSLLHIESAGANANSNQKTTSTIIRNTHSGTNSTNVALSLSSVNGTNNYGLIVGSISKSGFLVTDPTAVVHISGIGSTAAGTAPLKFASQTLMTIPEDGAVEYHGSHLYFTIGSTRYQLDQQSGGTWGSITGTLSAQTDLGTALGLKAPLASPTFTGVPAAPTAATTTNTTQVATTAFVQQELTASTSYFGSMFGGTGTALDPIIAIAAYNNQTGTTYTLVAGDNGKVVTLNNASAITLTVPTSLPAGFNCSIVQLGAGQVTITASGTTINNRQSFTKTAGQYSAATILQYTTNTFLTQGDMA